MFGKTFKQGPRRCVVGGDAGLQVRYRSLGLVGQQMRQQVGQQLQTETLAPGLFVYGDLPHKQRMWVIWQAVASDAANQLWP